MKSIGGQVDIPYQQSFRYRLIAALLIVSGVLFAWIGSELPRTSRSVFASPDETAVMVFAHAWTWEQGFRIPSGIPDELSNVSGLHPRSMVQQGDALVPVGFLGMPMLIGVAERLMNGLGSYITLIIVLSSCYPLFALCKKRSVIVGVAGVILYLSFPVLILYVNRGLFPNAPILAFCLWAIWGMHELARRSFHKQWQTIVLQLVTGLTFGLALCIRPSEAVWMIPWVLWGAWEGSRSRSHSPEQFSIGRFLLSSLKTYGLAAGMMLLLCTSAMVMAMKTYPFHGSVFAQPVIGYALKDVSISQATNPNQEQHTAIVHSNINVLPFGFHPRTLWTNMKVYLFQYLGVWFFVAIGGLILVLWQGVQKSTVVFLALSTWTIAVLFLLYGQAAYTDNIRGTAALGNSFLRYLLPLTPLYAIGIAIVIERLLFIGKRWTGVAVLFLVFFVLYGVTTAYARDEEGLLQTKQSLLTYAAARRMTESIVPAGSIILSERSDKLFDPNRYIVVSPLPSPETLQILHHEQAPLYLFHRIINTIDDLPVAIRHIETVDPKVLFTVGNEGLYELKNIEKEASDSL